MLSARIIQKLGSRPISSADFPRSARARGTGCRAEGPGEISAGVRDIMAACDLPVLVDGDDGYGDVKNVVCTVQSYERWA